MSIVQEATASVLPAATPVPVLTGENKESAMKQIGPSMHIYV